jgi:NitT/TauT family transport system permease protein
MVYSGILSIIANMLVDTAFSWARMFIALGISVLIGLGLGIHAAMSKRGERFIVPIIDVLQTIPILTFFPFVIFIFVGFLPGFIGINAAVIFLIVTSMAWNIIFGVYEAVKTMPKEFVELANLYALGFWQRLRKIFIPAATPRLVQQSILSWSIGLFYLVTSEIFSIGNSGYAVEHGIGAALACPSLSGNSGFQTTIIGIAIFILFVIATRLLFFRPLENYANRYTRQTRGKRVRTPTAITTPIRMFRVIPERMYGVVTIPLSRRKRSQKTKAKKTTMVVNTSRYIKLIIVLSIVVIALVLATNTTLLHYEIQALYSLVFSIARVWLAFVVSLAIAIPVCVYLVFMTRHTNKYLILFQIMASIPATIILPAIAYSLHSVPYHGELVAFIIFVLSGIWYLIFSMMSVSRFMPQSINEVKGVFGIKGFSAWRNIYTKALIPGIITGAITAVAAEWNASIVAEYFTSCGISGGAVATGGTVVLSNVKIGIGTLLDHTLASGNLVLMLVALANLLVMILLINTFVWRKLYKKVSKIYE